MKNKIIILLFLLLAAAITSGLIYLNTVFLPVKLKAYLISTLEDASGYKAGIGEIKYNLLKGVVIRDIVIYDKTNTPENTILAVKEASFNFLFLPLLKKQKIIIPLISIRYPYLHIRYGNDGTFNFSRILNAKKQVPAKKSKLSFFVYKIKVYQAKCLFEDEHFSPKFSKSITGVNLGIILKRPANVSFLMQGNIPSGDDQSATISVNGDYGIASRQLNARANLNNIIFSEFSAYLAHLPFSISSGSIDSAALDIKSDGDIFHLEGDIAAKNVFLAYKKLSLSGNIFMHMAFGYSRSKKETAYEINFNLPGDTLKGIDYINTLNNIRGNLTLTDNSFSTDGLQLKTLGSDFTLRASVENFDDPYLKLKFSSTQADLEKIFALLNPPKDLKLTGSSSVTADVEGKLNIAPLAKKVTFDITNAVFKTALLKEPLNNISGNIILAEDGADCNGLNFTYRNTPYNCAGQLKSFKAPRITFGLNSKDLNLKADLKIDANIIKINSAQGKYLDSAFSVSGNIDNRESKNPILDLTIKSDLKISDTLGFLPAGVAEKLKKMKLDGDFSVNGSLSGEAKEYKNYLLLAKATSRSLRIYGLKFSGFAFDIAQKGGLMQINGTSASSGYSGTMDLQFNADLKSENRDYSLKFKAAGIDLGKLKSDIGLKDRDVTGIVNIEAQLKGGFKNMDDLKGYGFIDIKEGKLWQINLFKGLGELFLLPDYKKIVFKDASCEFDIENKEISSDNIKLQSEPLILDCSGKMDFDGNLDFTIYSTANKQLIRDSADIRKFFAAVVGELSGAIAVKLTGTVKDPKFSMIPMPVDLIKNIKNFILGK